MSRRLNPNDIPADNTRHDFIVVNSGSMKRGEDSVPAVLAMIDNGPFKGKRVTSEVSSAAQVGTRFNARLRVLYTAMVGGKWTHVDANYKASNPRIRYALEDLADPRATSEVVARDPRAKFKRGG